MAFSILPIELLLIIFDYATHVAPVHEGSILRWQQDSFRETLTLAGTSIPVKSRITRTSRAWHDIMRPNLHEWIVLKHNPSLDSLARRIQSLSPGDPSPFALTKRLDLNLDHLPYNYNILLALIIRSMPNLRELNFALNHFSYVDCPLDVDICQAIMTCSSLRVLNWYTEIFLPMSSAWHNILACLPALEVTTCVHSLRTRPYNEILPVPQLPALHTLLLASNCNGCLAHASCALPALRALVYHDRSISFSRGRFRADQTWRSCRYFTDHGAHIREIYMDADEDENFMERVVALCTEVHTLHIKLRIPGPIHSRPFPATVQRLLVCNAIKRQTMDSVSTELSHILSVLVERPGVHKLRTVQFAHLFPEAEPRIQSQRLYDMRAAEALRNVDVVDSLGYALTE
ncbi:hypothetical protein HDZ31DRAFT_32980 [Schizophyllum fasciatum]